MSFLKKKRVPKLLFLLYQVISKSQKGKLETVERTISHEGMRKLDNLFKPIVTNTLIGFRESGQTVLPKSDALF